MYMKEKFIKELIESLEFHNTHKEEEDENIDVCSIVSVVDQQIEKCQDFMEDISSKEFQIGMYKKDTTEGYTNGDIYIYIIKGYEDFNGYESPTIYENYHYCIEFLIDERFWGYCDCSPEDEGYNEEYGCCGKGCDWVAPKFSISKIFEMETFKWVGLESEYWDYKKEYEERLRADEKLKHLVQESIKKTEKQKIELQIKELQERLADLEA